LRRYTTQLGRNASVKTGSRRWIAYASRITDPTMLRYQNAIGT
jgi:hypothetical protein